MATSSINHSEMKYTARASPLLTHNNWEEIMTFWPSEKKTHVLWL